VRIHSGLFIKHFSWGFYFNDKQVPLVACPDKEIRATSTDLFAFSLAYDESPSPQLQFEPAF
jgi:hypothetical protein